MELKTVNTSDLKPHSKNPNTHPQEQLNELQSSLEQFDQVKNIVVWQGQVIAGCGLLEAAKKQGRKEIEIQDVSDWPENKAIKYMIADNRLSEIAIMDDDVLIDLLRDIGDPLDVPGIDEAFLDELGFENETGGEGETDPDEVPENVESVVKSGELWLLGDRHRVLCGDATKQEDVERVMGGKKADMVFTDPPYGVDYASKNEFLNNVDKGNRNQVPIKNDKLGEGTFELWGAAFKNFKNILSDYHSIYICSPQTRDLMMMMMMMERGGIYISNVIIWVKNNHVLGRLDYMLKHEPIVFGWLQKGKHKFYGAGEQKFSVWEYNKPLKNDLHPTMKPVELIENAIKNSSKANGIILDIFGGSGSTLIACEKTNRKCMMMEIDEHYCTVILQRWADFVGKDPIREDGMKFSELKK